MLLWRYLLEADRRADLTQLDTAKTWLRMQPWAAPGDFDVPADWTHNIFTLRSLARRLGHRKVRRAVPVGEQNDAVADRTAFRYLGLMRRVRKSNFRGLKMLPSVAVPGLADRMALDWSTMPATLFHVQLWQNGGELFWQYVFDGLFTDIGVAVCSTCGRWLGETTPSGRQKTGSVCRRCKRQRWWCKLTTEEKRARWAADNRARKIRKHLKGGQK
jgi:hypothetical protein